VHRNYSLCPDAEEAAEGLCPVATCHLYAESEVVDVASDAVWT
jgi:hypothetical protein